MQNYLVTYNRPGTRPIERRVLAVDDDDAMSRAQRLARGDGVIGPIQVRPVAPVEHIGAVRVEGTYAAIGRDGQWIAVCKDEIDAHFILKTREALAMLVEQVREIEDPRDMPMQRRRLMTVLDICEAVLKGWA